MLYQNYINALPYNSVLFPNKLYNYAKSSYIILSETVCFNKCFPNYLLIQWDFKIAFCQSNCFKLTVIFGIIFLKVSVSFFLCF